jgi:hypothetical protein
MPFGVWDRACRGRRGQGVNTTFSAGVLPDTGSAKYRVTAHRGCGRRWPHQQCGGGLSLPLLLQLRHDLARVLLLLRRAVLQHVLQLLLLVAQQSRHESATLSVPADSDELLPAPDAHWKHVRSGRPNGTKPLHQVDRSMHDAWFRRFGTPGQQRDCSGY